jgi:NAD(P)-dependent dehydrogenase (short-subunit alcohol dehydrogenase family)
MTTVLITGANRGIGLELAKQYAAQGANVLACCRDASSAHDLRALQGVTIHEVAVGDSASVNALAAALKGQVVDILINNAGTMGPARDQQTFSQMDFEGWADAFNINSMGPVRVMQTLLPNLRAAPAAKVVTITSQLGSLAADMAFAYAYSSSKAALNKFMKLAALELVKEGMTCCVIHPGWVQTDMGGKGADITPLVSAEGIVQVIAGLDASNNGSFWTYAGVEHAW